MRNVRPSLARRRVITMRTTGASKPAGSAIGRRRRNRINTALAPRMAAQQAPRPQVQAGRQIMYLDRLQRII